MTIRVLFTYSTYAYVHVYAYVHDIHTHTHTQAAEATMETHTLARYISESTLQEYQFVDVKPSLIAASAMYLALRMKKLGLWVSELCASSCIAIGLRELRLCRCIDSVPPRPM